MHPERPSDFNLSGLVVPTRDFPRLGCFSAGPSSKAPYRLKLLIAIPQASHLLAVPLWPGSTYRERRQWTTLLPSVAGTQPLAPFWGQELTTRRAIGWESNPRDWVWETNTQTTKPPRLTYIYP